MADVIQANLKPTTLERISKIAEKPPTRGIDKMINQCLDRLEANQRNCAAEDNVGSEEKP